MARPSEQDFPKHKGGLFGNFGNFGNFGKIENFGKLKILEILEIRKVRGENFVNFGIEFGRADRHRSDDRPCATTQLRGHGLSRGGGGDHIYIYMYIYIYVQLHMYTYIDIAIDTGTDIDIDICIYKSLKGQVLGGSGIRLHARFGIESSRVTAFASP